MKRKVLNIRLITSLCTVAVGLIALVPDYSWADKGSGSSGGGTSGGGGGGKLAPLATVAIPTPTNLEEYVLNKQAAITLGKALFWDMQAGGDGKQACASCHFHAGTDNRTRNQFNGSRGALNFVANKDVKADDFPLPKGLVFGSQGVIHNTFAGLSGNSLDNAIPVDDPVFNTLVNGKATDVRRSTGRNTPSAINAIFNSRQFWDGRAKETFNGVNPGGPNPNALVLHVGALGALTLEQTNIDHGSAASQADGPPNNGVEMSWDAASPADPHFPGRSFPELGKKMLNLKPLDLQKVHPQDSVLGYLSNNPQNGLHTTYPEMVQAAFKKEWWESPQCVDGTKQVVACDSPNSFTVMQANFSLFWGLAIQMYESTLIANERPLDRYLAGNPTALTAQQQKGLNLFTGKANCSSCHAGAELTKASVSAFRADKPLDGFRYTGVTSITEDGGIQDGKMKMPGLSNVELTGPYFHNGGAATLSQVVDFYSRGGNFKNDEIKRLDLKNDEKDALVAFMCALTDERVRYEKAPFDHPYLTIHNGANPDGSDNDIPLKAVGSAGRSIENILPLQSFMGINECKR